MLSLQIIYRSSLINALNTKYDLDTLDIEKAQAQARVEARVPESGPDLALCFAANRWLAQPLHCIFFHSTLWMGFRVLLNAMFSTREHPTTKIKIFQVAQFQKLPFQNLHPNETVPIISLVELKLVNNQLTNWKLKSFPLSKILSTSKHIWILKKII